MSTPPQILIGDCRAVMAGMEAASVDAIVTDPPYGLEFMGKEWDRLWDNRAGDPEKHQLGKAWAEANGRQSGNKGYAGLTASPNYGKDSRAMQAWHETWAVEAFRVLKPGGHLLAFSGTRTSHRMVCAIEDAGFEIRDSVMWVHAQGFPKSHNLPGGLGTALKPAHEPICVARKPLCGTVARNVQEYGTGALNIDGCRIGIESGDEIHAKNPHTVGTIGVNGIYGAGIPTPYEVPQGRWPANVILSHHPACVEVGVRRVKGSNGSTRGGRASTEGYRLHHETGQPIGYASPDGTETVSAWDCHPDCAAAALDAQTGERTSGGGVKRTAGTSVSPSGWRNVNRSVPAPCEPSTGGASRFFLNVAPGLPIDGEDVTRFRYMAKASRAERNAGLDGMPARVGGGMVATAHGQLKDLRLGEDYERPIPKTANHHPTVKPIALMRWLVRLVCPKDGTVLDPFAGSGSTGIACVHEGFRFIGIEQSEEYAEIARRRIAHAVGPLFAAAD